MFRPCVTVRERSGGMFPPRGEAPSLPAHTWPGVLPGSPVLLAVPGNVPHSTLAWPVPPIRLTTVAYMNSFLAMYRSYLGIAGRA
jgi:hypothetical protein